MNKNVAIALATIFLAIALVYPTYAIFQSMTEDVRHSLEPLQNASQSIKDFFNVGGWDVDTEVNNVIETTIMRNQIAFAFLAVIEIICACIFGVALKMSL